MINNELEHKFGGSDLLQLSSMDWLERGMHAKTVNFDIGQGGLPPEVTWEDKCAAIATISNAAAKSLATILLWGNDNNWNWSGDFDVVIKHLAGKMLEQCRQDGQGMPKGYDKTLQELARLMGRMTLYFELYQLWDFYTVKGRLAFCGIDVNHRTYSKQFLNYQRLMLDELAELVVMADDDVRNYRWRLDS